MRKTRTITPTEMRILNRSAVLDLVRRESPISRSGIAEKLDVSLPTVMRIIDELIEEELVRPLGITEWSGGRRRSLLEFNARSQVMVGVDLGGGEIYGAAADLAGNFLVEQTQPLDGACGEDAYQKMLAVLEEILPQAQAAGHRVRGIGVGVPGITDYKRGVVRSAPSLDWQEFPLRQRLMERFALPVIVDNDVNLSALGELWFGTGQNVDNLVMLSVGIGIGAGIVMDGAIYRGSHQSAGEIGFLLPGREYLGKPYQGFGALERLAGTRGILERAQAARGGVDGLKIEDVFGGYRAGEVWARQVMDETADYLAMAVGAVLVCLDPDLIVLGGALSEHLHVLLEPVQERVCGTLLTQPKLVVSSLGRRAAAMGAVTNVLHHNADFYVLRSMA